MSSLFKKISEEAALQRAQIIDSESPTLDSPIPEVPAQRVPAPPVDQAQKVQEEQIVRQPKKVVPQSGTVAPQKNSESPQLDLEKLKIIIAEISQMQTARDGLNVRMSEQEMQDIEDFVLITLRKQGLRGYEVSIAKLMRYALRYMFRVHEKEFVSALKQVLKTEETLSI